MAMGIRLRAGRAVLLPLASFPARIPCSSPGLPGRPPWVPRVPRRLCSHPLLRPCSGMCPDLRLGDFTLQMPLPRACFHPAACGQLRLCPVLPARRPARAQPHRAPMDAASRPQQGEGQDAPSAGSFGGRCQPKHLEHLGVPQAVPGIAFSPPCHPKDTVFLPN